MAIQQKDIKILWGRSGNRCAICRIELTQDTSAVTSSFTLGEQAHIVGDKTGSARSNSSLTSKQRDSYHNLILLCPNHHTEIDGNEVDWPIERLHQIKSEHELWVSETLSNTIDPKKLARQVVIASIIDSAVDLCDLENWQNWTSYALAPDPTWEESRPDKIYKFRQKVVSAIWYDEFQELKNSASTLSIFLHRAAQKFLEHAVLINDIYHADKFYKITPYDKNYDEDLRRYIEWIQNCHNLIEEGTKAANWFADVIRRDINPMFFAEKGKFLITQGPFEDLSFRTKSLEFTNEEKEQMPDSLD